MNEIGLLIKDIENLHTLIVDSFYEEESLNEEHCNVGSAIKILEVSLVSAVERLRRLQDSAKKLDTSLIQNFSKELDQCYTDVCSLIDTLQEMENKFNNYDNEESKILELRRDRTEELKKLSKILVNKVIEIYNDYVSNLLPLGLKPILKFEQEMKCFFDFDEKGFATLREKVEPDSVSVDDILEDLSKFASIKDLWKSKNEDLSLRVQSWLIHCKNDAWIWKTTNFRQVVELIHDLNLNETNYSSTYKMNILAKIEKDNPIALRIYNGLGFDKIVELLFSYGKAKDHWVVANNIEADKQLLAMFVDEFQVGQKYTCKYLAQRLQHLYNSVGLLDKSGEIRKARLSDLKSEGWYILRECKILTAHGIVNGRDFVQANFTIRRAA